MSDKLRERIVSTLEKDLADFGLTELEARGRIKVVFDTEQFNYKEDESVWAQYRERKPWVCEVYFDDVWCCDMKLTDSADKLRNIFFKGFERGYDSGKIRLNRFLASLEAEEEAWLIKGKKEDEKKKIESLPEATPEERVAKEIIKEIAKENDETPINSATTE